MAKYNVGDKVRIINHRGRRWNSDGLMDKYMGKVMTIREIMTYCDFTYRMVEDQHEHDNGWFWREDDIVGLVKDEIKAKLAKKTPKFKIGDKVRITGDSSDYTDHLDGKIGEVVAVTTKDVAVKVEGSNLPWMIWNHNAELVEEDKDGYYKVSMASLYGAMGTIKPEEPKYYNGKVVCVSRGYDISTPLPCFTVGKVYEVVGGVITGDDGYKSSKYCNIDRLCGAMGWKFVPFVE